MPAVAKKNKNVAAPKPESEMPEKTAEKPKKRTVISGQLQKAIHNKHKRKAARKFKQKRGVIFVRHLPHGFFEDQLKSYFQQFGAVTRLRLARSSRSGNSKGYAFVEFAVPEVAQIAAETMDNYLMFRKIVNATYIPPESQRFNYFKTSLRKVQNKLGKSIYVSHKTRAVHRKVREMNKWNEENYETRVKKSINKLNKLKHKYADLGIDFDEYINKPDNVSNSANTSTASSHSESFLNASVASEQPGSLLLIKKPKVSGKKPHAKELLLKSLLEETIDEENSSDDDDFQPDDTVESCSSEASTTSAEAYDETPQKPKRHVAKQTNAKPAKQVVDRLEKIIKRNPLDGKIQKKDKKQTKLTKTGGKSQALQQKIQDTARTLVQDNKVAHLKGKDLKKKKKRAV